MIVGVEMSGTLVVVVVVAGSCCGEDGDVDSGTTNPLNGMMSQQIGHGEMCRSFMSLGGGICMHFG